MVLAAPPKQNDYISFLVDTTLEGVELPISSNITPDFDTPESSLKRYFSNPADHGSRPVKRGPHFNSTALAGEQSSAPLAIAGAFHFDGHQSFCEPLLQCYSLIVKPQTCVGTLETAI